METLTLNIDSKIYESFLKILQQFKKNEIQIVLRNNSFENVRNSLIQELNSIDDGNAVFLTLEEFEKESENAILKRKLVF